jgi:hypothetical protein
MTDVEAERPITDQENVESWAKQTKNLKKLSLDRDSLEEEITTAENQLNHMKRSVSEMVDSLNGRRIFKTSFGLVIVERFRKKAKKYRVGDTPPPAEYGVKIEIVDIEER